MDLNYEEILGEVRDILGENANGIYLCYSLALDFSDYNVTDDFVDRYEMDDSDGDPLIKTTGEMFEELNLPDNWTYRYGITKLTLYPKSANKKYVVKIPVAGLYTMDNDIYEYVPMAKSVVNYIEEEQDIFADSDTAAKDILLDNIFIGSINSMPVYIQKKVFRVYDESYSYTGNVKIPEVFFEYYMHLKQSLKYRNLKYSIDCKFAYLIYRKFGATRFKSMLKELTKITDLHAANYGFTENLTPVVFDYAGYDSCSWNFLDDFTVLC